MKVLERFNIIIKSKVNKFLDDKWNKPEVYKQLIRELEGALAELRDSADAARADEMGIDRQIGELTAAIKEKQAVIDMLLTNDNPDDDIYTVDIQIDVDKLEKKLAVQVKAKESAHTVYEELAKAVKLGEEKHQAMVEKYENMEMLARTTAAKNRASGALEAASGTINSLDNGGAIERKLQGDADKANAKFDRAVTGIDSGKSDGEKAAAAAIARAKIEARKKELAGTAE